MEKAIKIWRKSMIILWGLFLPWTLSASMAIADVATGRTVLFNNGNPTYDGLIQANGLFKEATGDPDPLKAAQAKFFYAFTNLAVSVLQEGPEADEMDSLKELLEAFGIVRSPYNSMKDGLPVTDLPMLNSRLNLPEGSPGGQAVQTFLAGPFLNAIEESLANLNEVTNNPMFEIQLTAEETGDGDIEIDYGDVLVYKSFLYNLKSLILLFNAYNLEMDIRETIALDNARVLQIQRDLLDKYPDLLKLSPETGVLSMAESRAALLSGIEAYRQALNFITSETDYQEDDLFYFGTEGELNVARALLTNLTEVRNSLDENRPAVLDDGPDEVWELTETISGDKLYLEVSLDNNGALKEGRFWGVAWEALGWGGEIIEWAVTGNNLAFKTSFSGWIWPAGQCRIEASFIGLLSGTDYNLMNGMYSISSNTCSAPPFPADVAFTGLRNFRESHVFKVDLNHLYGNTGKNPLNIRHVLPQFDQSDRIVAGTFPPVDDSTPVLNGLFPDLLTNGDLTQELKLLERQEGFVDIPLVPDNTIDVTDDSISDWAGLDPIFIDSTGEYGTWRYGSDIDKFYLAKDGTFLYLRLDVGNGTPNKETDGVSFMLYVFVARNKKNGDDPGDILVTARWDAIKNSWVVMAGNRSEAGKNYDDGYAGDAGNSLEWKVPLTDIGDLQGRWIRVYTHWVLGNDLPADENFTGLIFGPPASVSGTIACDFCTSGNIYVYASLGPDWVNSRILGTAIADSSGNYEIEGLRVGGNYYISAFWDADGNGIKTSGDYVGKKDGLTSVLSGGTGNVDFTVDERITGIVLQGDINMDGAVDLEDAILALQVLASKHPLAMQPGYAASGADVDGDNKIGMPEIIFILQKLAGLRAGGPLTEVPLTVTGNVSTGVGAVKAPGKLEAPFNPAIRREWSERRPTSPDRVQGRLSLRAPLSQEKIVYLQEHGQVIYSCGKKRGDNKVFMALDWLAALTAHIPGRGEQMVHYYGWYSNKSRGIRQKNTQQHIQKPLVILPELSATQYRRH